MEMVIQDILTKNFYDENWYNVINTASFKRYILHVVKNIEPPEIGRQMGFFGYMRIYNRYLEKIRDIMSLANMNNSIVNKDRQRIILKSIEEKRILNYVRRNLNVKR